MLCESEEIHCILVIKSKTKLNQNSNINPGKL